MVSRYFSLVDQHNVSHFNIIMTKFNIEGDIAFRAFDEFGTAGNPLEIPRVKDIFLCQLDPTS
jgi:hypothetical protein